MCQYLRSPQSQLESPAPSIGLVAIMCLIGTTGHFANRRCCDLGGCGMKSYETYRPHLRRRENHSYDSQKSSASVRS